MLTEGKRWYERVYLQSPHWKAMSVHFKQDSGGRCNQCGERRGLQLHHNGYGDGYDDENGRSLLWREGERPHLMQVLCEGCHEKKHPEIGFLREEEESLEPWMTPWMTPEEEWVADLLESGIDPEEDDSDDEVAREMMWEEMYALGLDPDDPDFSELAAEGLEGDEDGNYDDEAE